MMVARIPDKFDYPYNKFDRHWKEWARSLNRKEVRFSHAERMALSGTDETFEGYHLRNYKRVDMPTPNTTPWIPLAWIQIISGRQGCLFV